MYIVSTYVPYIANCSWWKTFADAESNLISWKTFTVDCQAYTCTCVNSDWWHSLAEMTEEEFETNGASVGFMYIRTHGHRLSVRNLYVGDKIAIHVTDMP